jgi:hypothetical protein
MPQSSSNICSLNASLLVPFKGWLILLMNSHVIRGQPSEKCVYVCYG